MSSGSGSGSGCSCGSCSGCGCGCGSCSGCGCGCDYGSDSGCVSGCGGFSCWNPDYNPFFFFYSVNCASHDSSSHVCEISSPCDYYYSSCQTHHFSCRSPDSSFFLTCHSIHQPIQTVSLQPQMRPPNFTRPIDSFSCDIGRYDSQLWPGWWCPCTDPSLWHPQDTEETKAIEKMGFLELLQRLD